MSEGPLVSPLAGGEPAWEDVGRSGKAEGASEAAPAQEPSVPPVPLGPSAPSVPPVTLVPPVPSVTHIPLVPLVPPVPSVTHIRLVPMVPSVPSVPPVPPVPSVTHIPLVPSVHLVPPVPPVPSVTHIPLVPSVPPVPLVPPVPSVTHISLVPPVPPVPSVTHISLVPPVPPVPSVTHISLVPPVPPVTHVPLEPSVPPVPSDSLHTGGNPVGESLVEVKEEPPADWFEPLEDDEDDDALSFGRNDAEEESLAGESERSESVAGSEKAHRKIYQLQIPRRKRSHPDEGWEEWPVLGEGWKRKEVIRRSGSSVGQKDVYYVSPQGDRVRSRVELATVLEGILNLSAFDYRSGKFLEGQAPPIRIRNRAKRKIRERSSSESSFMERGEGADTPDSYHRLTPSLGPKSIQSNQTGFSSYSTQGTLKQYYRHDDPSAEDRIKLPLPSSSQRHTLPSIKGEIGTEDSTLVCARCGISFTGTWYDKQRKRPCCPSCWAASKTKEHPMIRFRKWIPCGQCVGCHNTINCGQCANCKHGLQSPESRKRICRKRKCICPIRKGPGSGGLLQQKSYNDAPENFDDTCMSFQSEFADSQHPSLKSSDTENFSVNVDVDDDDDMSTDDDDDWHKKRKRRSCGECNACLCRKDCGTCDFCVDKPKFGGSNKKRQKCRLRQCQRQAMMGQGDYGPEGLLMPGRPRPHYTYSRKSSLKKNKGPPGSLDVTDNEDDDHIFQPISWSSEPASGSKHNELSARNHHSSMEPLNYSNIGQRNGVPHISNHNNSQLEQLSRWDAERSYLGRDGQRHIEEDYYDDEEEEEDEEDEEEDDEFPMITQIFSLADNSAGSGADVENQLLKLLHSLRSSALPILWYAIIVDGPQLQLTQCSKQSNMTDTMVLIDPGFFYQVTVQKQPLLPTHPLYDNYPACLTSASEVVNLLLGLEKYFVCQGLSPKESSPKKDPIILERASTCDFLVKKNVSVCTNCRALQGL
ncbi:methyl-CpG-binding domain protein 1b isoform X3 [Scophthalmus maximus]|uniref:methyl-CpG-binding domain protein 1b isoform X3 n=1 Tax=Scophthalmus maximus TaxID=52904 RepID=UPI001FA8F77D|nr:methyl-CpG-binding domain protein 1b isoform X3 [Scophthalmus maximus]